MSDLFNFSFPDFSGFSDLLSGGGENSGSFGFSDQTPDITQALFTFALSQATGQSSSRSSMQKLLNGFARQAIGGVNQAPQSQSGTYFRASHGQSLAQLASMLTRAQRNL